MVDEWKTGYLRTYEQFLKAYGAPEWAELIFGKADDPLTLNTTNNLYHHVGAKLWVHLNTEKNLWAFFDKEAWGPANGWRIVTSWGSTKVTWQGELDNLPDSKSNDYAILKDLPKLGQTKFDQAMLADLNARRGQAITWEQYVELKAEEHKLGLCEALAAPIGEEAANAINPSLDHGISSYDEYVNCASVTALTTAASQLYLGTVDRSAAASQLDATVLHNSEVLRALSLYHLDDLIDGVMDRSGIYDTDGYVFMTGTDTITRLSQLWRGHVNYSNVRVNINGSGDNKEGMRRIAGTDMGFALDAYRGIPFVPSKHMRDSLKPVGGLTPIYLIYMPHVKLWIDRPTSYEEHGWKKGEAILVNKNAEIGLFTTVCNLHFYYFLTMGKARDLKVA